MRALLGKDEGQLRSGAALQGGMGDVVVDEPGDALRVAVRLLHQCHVVACTCNTAEPHMRLSPTFPGLPRVLRLTAMAGSWERGWRAGGLSELLRAILRVLPPAP